MLSQAQSDELDGMRRRAETGAEWADICALEAMMIAANNRRRPPGECAYCDKYGHESMMPSHEPSRLCESGKRPHCTCDVCF